MTEAQHPSLSPCMRPLVALLLVALVFRLVYTVANRLLRQRLGHELAAKRVLQIVSASVLSVSTTLEPINLWRGGSLLTAWSPVLSVTTLRVSPWH